jgi:DNA helicase HerA-like ATPase
LTQVTNRSKRQWSSQKNDNQQVTTSQSGGMSQTFSGELINYRAQYLINLLQRELERLDQSMAAGQWLVRTYFGANTADDAKRLASLVQGAMAGTDSRPEPVRTTLCQEDGIALDHFQTFLTSQEVSLLVQLPREEVPGYALYDHVRFDVDFHTDDPEALPLGQIQHNGKNTVETYNISLDALAKHAVVIGVTGSGKTTTVMNLIDRVVQANKPFLVIEPAKTEYRSLHTALAPKPLHVYTLGNDMIAPFRLNPFEFETDDDPGNASLLTHIDFMKAVFNAAFPLYAPMPQVLEEALHEIYEDKGWDLTSGVNRRLANWEDRHKHPIFPTLTDLYVKVEEVTVRLGYDKEVESNVKAALKSRIGSLRIGSKGLMLDTPRSIPMSALLSIPTILELENIGNDDEKTFIMGLFLARLYEYRRLQFARGTLPSGLQHLIVFEEAHRLLKNTSTEVSADSSNPRAQAIEVFTNMLSEVRAYGQGVLVAEQIPSKLAPDVLKNTNLKIVHRLIAKDDRESIGQTMNLSEEQQFHLGILTPGMAAVYAEGADHAYLLRLENYKKKISPLPEARLRQMSQAYASVKPFQFLPDLDAYGLPVTRFGGPDPATYQAASKILDADKSKQMWSMLHLRLLSKPATVLDILARFSEFLETTMAHLSPQEHDEVLSMVFVKGGAEFLHRRGAYYGWTYNQVEELRILLTLGLISFHKMYILSMQAPEVAPEELPDLEEAFNNEMENASEHLSKFAEDYLHLTRRRQGPYVGCVYCPVKCSYRPDVNQLLTPQNREWLHNEMTKNPQRPENERYGGARKMAVAIVHSWLGEEPDTVADNEVTAISFCSIVHTLVRSGFNDFEQRRLILKLHPHFFGREEDEE